MKPLNPAQIRWNQKYLKKPLHDRNPQPSEWLRAHESLLKQQKKGVAFDMACGNGRNAFYLAALGFQVEAADISDVAIDWLTQQAEQQKASITPLQMDFEQTPLPTEKYQVLASFNYLQRNAFSALQRALAPGGLLFFETFSRDSIEVLGSTMNPDYVLDYNELLQAFSDLRILAYQETIRGSLEEGNPQAVASLVARKV